MMKIETKYNIGDKIFWLEKRDGIWRINYDSIKSINIGGKSFNRYEISYTTRGERDLYNEFTEAKQAAIEKQKEFNKKALKIVEETRPPIDSN